MSPTIEAFVAHFGEMGSRWGINRTVSQVYALLFVSAEPMNADDIGAILGVSRSNVSMSLKELEGWQLVTLSRRPGDRREYYATLGSVWDIFRAVAAERRRREVEPTLSMLRQSLLTEPESAEDAHALKRMREMYELAKTANNWFDDLQRLSPESMKQLMKMGSKVQKLLEVKDRTTKAIRRRRPA
ncbi:MAG: MarR family transcriptional regulator [Hydrogenophaga sp.]|nr:MarR family transcriptional regulator [Hydrogenophaga sp.]